MGGKQRRSPDGFSTLGAFEEASELTSTLLEKMTPLSPDETGVAVAHMVSTLESLYSITHSLETGLTKHREALNKDPKCRHEVDEMDSTLIPLYVARDSLQVSFYLLSLARNRLLSP